MKNAKTSTQQSSATADSQNRLLAYSTAASLGAFYVGGNAQAALVQAPGLAPYPHVILAPPPGTATESHHYLSIESGSKTNFDLIFGPDLLSHTTSGGPPQVVELPGFDADTQPLTTLWVNGDPNAYIAAFFGGAVIGNNTNTALPSYHPRLALSYQIGGYPFVNYNWNGYLSYPNEYAGFKFKSTVDGQNHFGYLQLQINFIDATTNTLPPGVTKRVLQSVVIKDCRYESTPDAGVTIPKEIMITNITNSDNTVTIDFGPNSTENDDATVFTLETSLSLGSSAVWVADPNVISMIQVTTGDSQQPATYQVQTTRDPAVPTQFYRIKK
ncbi:MAG: hypothetical protein U1F98_01670 [Verrucomicrobiota bacterium]